MRRQWTLILATVLLVGGVATERTTAWFATRVRAARKEASARLETLQIRTAGGAQERARYAEVATLAGRLEETVRWEPDSTNVLRSFADVAAELNLRLVNSRLLPPVRKDEGLVNDTFARTRYAVQLEGAYAALVNYVERMERSPNVTIVEQFSLQANRDDDGTGELRLQLCCLHPPVAKASVAARESAHE